MIQEEATNIKNRIRKDARYSVLTTMTMRLLKKESMFQECESISESEKIKSQKNFSIIVLRLATIYRKMIMTKKYTQDELAEEICGYFRKNLMPLIERKYKKCQEKVKQMIFKQNVKNIRVLEKVLLSDLNSLQDIKKQLRYLYMPAFKDNLTKQQIASIDRLSQIFYRFTKNEVISIAQNQIEKLTSEEANNIDLNVFIVY